MERRLARILAADVAGYSRLMGEDETGRLAALKSDLAELMTPTIVRHMGRIVKTTGDGLLAEFASAVAAVQWAVALQRGMAERNKSVAEEKPEFQDWELTSEISLSKTKTSLAMASSSRPGLKVLASGTEGG